MTALRTLAIFQEITHGVQVSFDPYNITRGANYWFWVSAYAGSTEARFSNSQKLVTWSIPCQLDVRYTTEAESAGKLNTARGEILELCRKPRLLKNINVNKVTVIPNPKPLEQVIGGANFLVQQMTTNIEQIVGTR